MAETYGDASREMPWYKAADRSSWRALLASNLGWMFDGYETYILVLTGPAVIASLLSPEQTPIYFGILLAVTLAGWTVGGIGGGLVADRIGRKRTLMLSIFLYAIFTGLTALSPSILVFAIFRFLAGIGIGAEWGAGAVLVSEKFPNYARGRAAAILQSGFGVGFLLASIAWYFIAPLGPESWRYVFLLGILPAFLLLYVRRKVDDPEKWVEADQQRRAALEKASAGQELTHAEEASTRFAWRTIWATPVLRRRLLLTLLMSFSTILGWWAVSTWIPQYAAATVEAQWATYAALVYNVVAILGYVLMGFIADAVGRKLTIWAFFLGSIIMVPVVFLINHSPGTLLLVIAINGFFTLGQFTWMAMYLPELFPTTVRGSAASLVFNLTRIGAIVGILASGWLVSTLGGIPIAATIIGMIYILGLIVTPFAGPETKGEPLPDTPVELETTRV
jgi:MFS family permease